MLRLKIHGSHLTCKVANKCLNVREQLEVVEWNKRWCPTFPCCPVNRECVSVKKTPIEKKRQKKNKIRVRKFWGLIPTFAEVTGSKTGRGNLFAPQPVLNRVKNGSFCYFGVTLLYCFHGSFSLTLASRYHQHKCL